MVIFLLLSVIIGLRVLPALMSRVSRLPISQGALTLGLVVMFAYSLAAELFGGMAAITGAFLAGLMMARSGGMERVKQGVHALAYSLFVPVFFINIGLSVDARGLRTEMLLFTLLITVVGILGKWFGAGLGARLGGLKSREAVQLGAGMISRGEVGLIVTSVGIQGGLVNPDEFSAIVAMVLISTLVTPPLLRILFAREKMKGLQRPVEAAAAENLDDPSSKEST
jgi:Kef-type K+ transport system membrane component KefB